MKRRRIEMKRVMYVILLLSFVIGMTACNSGLPSSRTILSIGKPAEDNVIYFTHTDNKRKIHDIQDMFQNKKWKRNETFSTVNKTPDVVLSIDKTTKGYRRGICYGVFSWKMERTLLSLARRAYDVK